MVPKHGFAGGEERIFAGVPAQEVRGFGVGGVVFAGFPDFVKKKVTGIFGGAMQIVLQAAFFLAAGGNESAKFGFEEEVLTFFGTQGDD